MKLLMMRVGKVARGVAIELAVVSGALVAAQMGWVDPDLALMVADAVLERLVKGGW